MRERQVVQLVERSPDKAEVADSSSALPTN